MRVNVEENNNFDAFYPFFIIMVVFLVTFFRPRAKIKRELEEKRRVGLLRGREVPQHVATSLSPAASTVTVIQPPDQQKRDPIARKRRPRIVNLVQGLKSKKELVLLSEILYINSHVS